MSARTLVAIATVTVGVFASTAIASAAVAPDVAYSAKKAPSLASQIKKLKSQVSKNTKTGKKNTATGKKNTSTGKKNGAKIDAVGKSVATTVAGLNAEITAANQRTTDLNGKVDGIASIALDALTKIGAGLTQLGDGVTKLGAAFGNFEYGVVQVGTTNGTTITPIAGSFLATPRLDPTVEQATVTGQFPCAVAACATDKLALQVAVRSANPNNDLTSKVYCRVTASQSRTGFTSFVTSTPNGAFGGAPAYQVARSPLVPTDPAELASFPLSLVSTDAPVDLTTAANSGGVSNGSPAAGGFALGASGANGMISVTLSCLNVPNA